MSQRKASDDQQIDLTSAIESPLRIKQNGEITSVHPHEALLRQHIQKALHDDSVSSMAFVVGQAEKHDLIKMPPSGPTSGVFVIPKWVPEEALREYLETLPEENKRVPLGPLMRIVQEHFDRGGK